MGATTDLRREVKARFIPLAVQRGFFVEQEEMPNALRFRRIVNGSAQVFELRWEKYGKPRFALHFGTCPASGLSIRGQRIEPATALPGGCPTQGLCNPGRARRPAHGFAKTCRYSSACSRSPAFYRRVPWWTSYSNCFRSWKATGRMAQLVRTSGCRERIRQIPWRET